MILKVGKLGKIKMSILSLFGGYFLEWEAKKSTFNKWPKMDESYEKNYTISG